MFRRFNFGEMIVPRIHEEGFITIIVAAITSLAMLFFSKYLFLISLLITLLCVYFFRDPARVVPQKDDIVVSPADGLILGIVEDCTSPLDNKNESEDLYTRISIFLNVTNVHVNRIPISGVIVNDRYDRGKFINASFDKASEDNERQIIEIKSGDDNFVVTQIAGFVARRIVCSVKCDDEVKMGHRFGIIKFGSRVDLYIPHKYKNNINVAVGQTVIGGETIICDLRNDFAGDNLTFDKI